MELLSTADLMKMFGLKKSKTIVNWLYNGTLPRSTVVKIGRLTWFSKERIDAWLETKLQKDKELKNA